MTFKQLVMELVKREGGKRGVNIADMSEIVRCLMDILKEESSEVEQHVYRWVDSVSMPKPKPRPKRRKGKK